MLRILDFNPSDLGNGISISGVWLKKKERKKKNTFHIGQTIAHWINKDKQLHTECVISALAVIFYCCSDLKSLIKALENFFLLEQLRNWQTIVVIDAIKFLIKLIVLRQNLCMVVLNFL